MQEISPDRICYPTPRARPGTNHHLALHPEPVQSWRENGYTMVDGIFPAELIKRAVTESLPHFPEPGSQESEKITDYGSRGALEFPTPSDAINSITLHPRLLGAVSHFLGIGLSDLRLTQSEPWAKYGRSTRLGGKADNQDQRMHVDYPNHTLTHPADWERPGAVSIIVYYHHIEDCGGATEFVPRKQPDEPAYREPLVKTPGMAGLNFVNDR